MINGAELTHYIQFKPTRQRITPKGEKKPLGEETRLSDALGAPQNGWELQVKDLGPQIGWRTVFLVEYVRTTSGIMLIVSDTNIRYRQDLF